MTENVSSPNKLSFIIWYNLIGLNLEYRLRILKNLGFIHLFSKDNWHKFAHHNRLLASFLFQCLEFPIPFPLQSIVL